MQFVCLFQHNLTQFQVLIQKMGNKIGLEINNHSVKIVYVETLQKHIQFIRKLKSQYLVQEIEVENKTFFLFECAINQFLEYHTTQNALLLRKEFEEILGKEQLIIKTNRETLNIIQQNPNIVKSLESILLRKFQFCHKYRIQASLNAIKNLQDQKFFFNFKSSFMIDQLLNFHHKHILEKQFINFSMEKFLFTSIRNGLSFYLIENNKVAKKFYGSIIGEKTMKAILRLKAPEKTIQEIIDLAFEKGSIKNTDLMVSDIYGKQVGLLGLPGDLVASSMGKIGKMKQGESSSLKIEDIAKSILTLFAINTGIHISLKLKTESLDKVLISADLFHNNYFYWALQSIIHTFAGKDIQVYFYSCSPFIGCMGAALTQ